MPATTQFGEVSKNEHRVIRDALLILIRAFRNRDVSNIRHFLIRAAPLAGPRFRYEENAFNPALIEVLDEQQARKPLNGP